MTWASKTKITLEITVAFEDNPRELKKALVQGLLAHYDSQFLDLNIESLEMEIQGADLWDISD